MPAPDLPNEILQQIFDNIDKSSFSTLHSIILVNRSWCQNGISRLWAQPFSIVVLPKILPIIPRNIISIFPIYLSFLDSETITEFKANLKITDSDSSCFQISNLQAKRKSRFDHPLFDYPSFLQQIDLSVFLYHLFSWVKKNSRWSNKFSGVRKLVKDNFRRIQRKGNQGEEVKYDTSIEMRLGERLFLMFISRSKNFTNFRYKWTLPNFDYHEEIMKEFFSSEVVTNWLSNLSSLDFNFQLKSLITKFTPHLQNLNSLSLRFPADYAEDVYNLIRAQKNLEHLQIYLHIFNNYPIPSISPLPWRLSLSQHADTLKSFSIDTLLWVNFDEEALRTLLLCRKLESLKLLKLQLPKERLILFKDSCFTMLTELHLEFSHFQNYGDYLQYLTHLFDHCRNTLEILKIKMTVRSSIHHLIDHIAINCDNLMELSISVGTEEEMWSVLKLVKMRNKIRKLEIHKLLYFDCRVDAYLVCFGSILRAGTLRWLGLMDMKISGIYVEWFLRTCAAGGIKSLYYECDDMPEEGHNMIVDNLKRESVMSNRCLYRTHKVGENDFWVYLDRI
ncbi:207_t:CDS:1 [Acaulospora morrowiae]|uniref:207_t:CDS:1 n=1 Tax=Acaulospora morrowiae TaxID=94023 RepID=A0A9N9D7L5_9GLOM|nr:207_t:CDS:1 [Acaulospora morrowiae]